MRCEHVTPKLAQYCEQLLEAEQQALVEAHLDECAACRHEMRLARLEHQRYMRMVQVLPVPEPAPGKLAHMLKEAAEEPDVAVKNRTAAATRFWQFATAAALMLAVLLSPAKLFTSDDVLTQQREVSVAIDVPNAMSQVALALDFPEHLRWQGLEDRRRVAWTVDLKSGRNILTLPLVVSSSDGEVREQSTITATVAYQKGLRQFRLPVWLGEGQDQAVRPVSL
jgi:hypothetical protein